MIRKLSLLLIIFLIFGHVFCEEAPVQEKSEEGTEVEGKENTENSEKENEEKKVSTADKVFFCEEGYTGPSLIGWCEEGSYYGLIHFGNIGYVKTKYFYGFAQIGVVTVAEKDFRGAIQLSLASMTENYYGMFQIGALGAVAIKDFAGVLQFGGLASIALGKFKGFAQFGSVGAVALDFEGFLLFGGLFSGTDIFKGGLQISLLNMAGLGTKDKDEESDSEKQPESELGFYGAFQIGGILNITTTFKGASQIGTVNYSENHFGGQIGVYNHSEEIRGFQIGGINYAEKLYGVQIGLVNIAKNGFLPFMPIINVGW